MQTQNIGKKLEGNPKVLVGCPTSDYKSYCLGRYIALVKELSYDNFDFLIIDNSENDNYIAKIKMYNVPFIKDVFKENARERIVNSRNILRKKVLDEGYDYFLSLEQDVIPPKDIIERMLSYGKDVVTGVYFANNKMPDGSIKLIPLVYKLTDVETLTMHPLDKEELWDNQGLYKVVSAGLGCVLIHRSVLEKIEFRSENKNFDDRFFFVDCYNKKIDVFCDTSIKCKHLISRPTPWSTIKK